jgi:hypothetical protein
VKTEPDRAKPLPVILPAVTDELLSSWITRHATFYGVSPLAMLRHSLPETTSLRAIDTQLTEGQGVRLAQTFRRGPDEIRAMSHAEFSQGAERMLAARPIQECAVCAARNKHEKLGATITRGQLQAWRVTCSVCGSRLSAIGDGERKAAATPFRHLWADALRGERLLDDAANRNARTWISPFDLVRLLFTRRDPRPIDPEKWIEKPKVLDALVPGFDRFVAEQGIELPTASKVSLPLALRPALLAGVALAERAGPEIIANLQARTIGAHHSSFRHNAEKALSARHPGT